MADVITTTDYAKAQSIDFTNRFGTAIDALMEAMGATRKLPLSEGMQVKVYTTVADMDSGVVAEGAIIPLSDVNITLASTEELTMKKWRKAVSGEAIQKGGGVDNAVSDTDEALLKEVQKIIRNDLITFMATGTGTGSGLGLQGALATAWGNVKAKFDDDGVSAVAFCNPLDVADYLASANVTVQTAFGLTFVTGFTGVTLIVSSAVPEGKLYATAADNIVYAYVPVPNSTLATTFGMTSDESGYIGIVHNKNTQSLTLESTVATASKFFAEVIDAVFIIDIASVAMDDYYYGLAETAVAKAEVTVAGVEVAKAEAQDAVDLVVDSPRKDVLQARIDAIVVV